mmetsp:Transcript_21499/g.72359  ORF Transcript_21499/g.72359 Transcript_21499/m.72359 type:complete len:276 (+) Transcript_21499:1142-1969(+)
MAAVEPSYASRRASPHGPEAPRGQHPQHWAPHNVAHGERAKCAAVRGVRWVVALHPHRGVRDRGAGPRARLLRAGPRRAAHALHEEGPGREGLAPYRPDEFLQRRRRAEEDDLALPGGHSPAGDFLHHEHVRALQRGLHGGRGYDVQAGHLAEGCCSAERSEGNCEGEGGGEGQVGGGGDEHVDGRQGHRHGPIALQLGHEAVGRAQGDPCLLAEILHAKHLKVHPRVHPLGHHALPPGQGGPQGDHAAALGQGGGAGRAEGCRGCRARGRADGE